MKQRYGNDNWDLELGSMYLIEVNDLVGFEGVVQKYIKPSLIEKSLNGLVIEYIIAGLTPWNKYTCKVIMSPYSDYKFKYVPGEFLFLSGNERITFKKL